MFKNRICKQCGEEFTPTASKAMYCKKPVEKICPICGKTFISECHPKAPTTCNAPECKRHAGNVIIKAKICRLCGESFIPSSSRQVDCGRPIQKTCVICGKTFESRCGLRWDRNTCPDSECEKIYQHQKSVEGYKDVEKQCVLCGKMFTPRNNTQQICDDTHYRNCEVCGKSFELNHIKGRNIKDLPRTCSKECCNILRFRKGNPGANPVSRAKMKATIQAKYGADHPMQSPEIQAKVDTTMQERYGAKRFTQTSEYIDKAIATNQDKYGANWPMQSTEIQQKAADTLYDNYGVTNPMQSEELKKWASESYKERTGYGSPLQNPKVKAKVKQTNLDKYGVECTLQVPDIRAKADATMLERYGATDPFHSPELSAKIKATNIERYGFEVPTKSPEVQEKIASTMMSRYGATRYSQTTKYKVDMVTDPTKLPEWEAFLKDPIAYTSTKFTEKPSYRELAECLGVCEQTIIARIPEDIRVQAIRSTLSYTEAEVVEYLQQIKPNIVINRHNRKLIAPQEIDIYLPEYQLGIEINPTGTHNSTYGVYGNDPKAPSYHKRKTELCDQQGIFLFHIFGYEWEHKKDIIKSMLANLIQANTNRVYARKCEVREVENVEAIAFLNANHRQGVAYSKVRLGLYYQDELVSLMTFGMMRNTLGRTVNMEDCWELARFASKLNTTVIGGADKLFKTFIRMYEPKQIRSFSDRAHTKGTLYAKLGFTEIQRSDANYVWVYKDTNKAYNRVHAQKHNLKHFLQDDTIDLNQTEKQIMEAHGFVQVFDSGTVTWEWTSI